MSWREPDWLPMPAKRTGPDALLEALDSGDCEHCEGTGIDQDVLEGRGYRIDCEHCKGSGCQQEEIVDDPDLYGVDDV